MELPQNAFKRALKAGKAQIGLWSSLSSNYTVIGSERGFPAVAGVHPVRNARALRNAPRLANPKRLDPLPGSGLGLAIVSEIMKAHHGAVRVGDNPGGGAVLTLIFQRLP